MGKRSDFERIDKDYYRTIDPRAVKTLLPFLYDHTYFIEPCAGDGILIDQLIDAGHHCVDAGDINPQRADIQKLDALNTSYNQDNFDYFITNPPWSRNILHPLIKHLSDQNPTWLLFDADWIHTKQAIPFLSRLCVIVSVGRLRWIPYTKMDGKDNYCWYLFDKNKSGNTEFFGRQ